MSNGNLLRSMLAIALVTCGSACGKNEKNVYAVQGQVFVNKKPAANALVVLTPLQDAETEKWPNGYPRGHVQEDGVFRVTTYREGDGAPAGEYAVTVLWMVAEIGERESQVDKLQGRYAEPKASLLRVEVKADRQGNQLPAFQLD